MTDIPEEDVPSAEEIEAAAYADAENGIQSFSEGDVSITAMDPEKRLKVAQMKRRQEIASRGKGVVSVLGQTVRLNSPGAWS